MRFPELSLNERGVAAFERLTEEKPSMEVVGPPLGRSLPLDSEALVRAIR